MCYLRAVFGVVMARLAGVLRHFCACFVAFASPIGQRRQAERTVDLDYAPLEGNYRQLAFPRDFVALMVGYAGLFLAGTQIARDWRSVRWSRIRLSL